MSLFYRVWLPAILFALIGLICFIGFGYMHESVHKEIFEHYGISSEIHMIANFPDFTTVPMANNVNNCGESCLLAHDINEVVGYQLLPIFMFIFLALFMFFMEFLFLNYFLVERLRSRD